MKSFLIILGVLCLGIAAVVIHSDLKTATTIETNAAQPYVSPNAAPHANTTSPVKFAKPPTVPRSVLAAVHQPGANVPADPVAKALKEAVDQLVSRDVPFKQKQDIWKQLIADGRLDEAMEALKQGAANNPDSAEYQSMLGQANLLKAGIASKNGASVNEMGILGMTADQSFDNALKIDPSNWDAQFLKAVAMSYWPAELNKGDEVAQRLTALITQQNSMTPQPEFAMPYVALGQQYQKLGQNDNALQTWQAGATKFPNDTTLQQKLAAAAQH